MKNYITKIRRKIGHDKFIHPAVRIMIENDKNEILFIERIDNGKLGIPAGALEENETIEACIRREVKEELRMANCSDHRRARNRCHDSPQLVGHD